MSFARIIGLGAGVLFTAASAQGAETLRAVGVSMANTTNPFYVQLGRGAEAAAKQINADAKVTVLGEAYDLNKQTAHIDDFIARKVDLIVLAATDSEAIGPAVQRARNAGIVVIAVDVLARNADAAVTTDNVQAGEISCRFIVDRLGGKGRVVILNGPPVSSVRDRVVGCKRVLEGQPQIKILSDSQDAKGSIEGGQKVMGDLLTANPQIDAVFAINDPTAVGAELAARQAHRGAPIITAVDGAPMAEKALRTPNGLFAATASQDPYLLGRTAVELGVKVLRHEPVEKLNLVKSKLVTRENVEQYRGWTK